MEYKGTKCKCDKYFASKGFHYNGCKYAIKYNKAIDKTLKAKQDENRNR